MSAVEEVGIIIWNMIVFALYGVDKIKAKNRLRRVSEKTLIWCTFLMGSIGAAVGMTVFRHKIRKPLFKVCVPFAILVNIWIFVLLERM